MLREHQHEIINKIHAGFEQGHRCQLLWGVTGLGKTEIAIYLMQQFSKKYMTSAMVMDRIILVEQTSMRLNKYGIDHGVLQANHWRFRPHERIQVCSIQTIAKRSKNNIPDLLIVDECHILHRSIVKIIKDNPKIRVVGLTATPFTKGLGSIFTNVVAGPTYEDIIEKNWLVPLKVYIAKEINMEGAKKVAGEWSQDEASSRGIEITGDVVAEWEKKTVEVFQKPVKTIVFCAGVAHGRELEKKFQDGGYNFVSISYREDDEFKRLTVEEFSKPDSKIQGLIATDILTRGFDVSDVLIGISARPFSKSFSSHVQQIGRVMRPHEGKTFGLWLDHSGNFLRFRDDWEKLYTKGVEELDNGGEKAKVEPTKKQKEASKCPSCNVLWTFSSDTCESCGFVLKKKSQISVLPGLMEALDGAPKSVDSSSFHAELLFYARAKGYKDGWAAHKYKEKTGTFPKGVLPVPQKPSVATQNWIRARMIAFAKSQKGAGA